jgi:hypothetical protein
VNHANIKPGGFNRLIEVDRAKVRRNGRVALPRRRT